MGISTSKDMNPSAANRNEGTKVISATFSLPFVLGLNGDEWNFEPRQGTTPLFDSLRHLSHPRTPWTHTIVGWTGEINAVKDYPDTPESLLQHPRLIPGFESSAFRSSLASSEDSQMFSAAPSPAISPLLRAHGLSPSTMRSPSQPSSPRRSSEGSRRERSSGPAHLSSIARQSLEKQLKNHDEGNFVPIWLLDGGDWTDDTVSLQPNSQARWRRYAERYIYTVFHYRQIELSDSRSEQTSWADYCRMNELFADRIEELYELGDIIMIHNYQLMLLPSLLRKRLPNATIGFFLHIPLPDSEIVRNLVRRKRILNGVLGADMVAFQSNGHLRHFEGCCTRLLGCLASHTGADAFERHVAFEAVPIGINTPLVLDLAYGDHGVKSKMARFQAQHPDQRIIVGHDRIDGVQSVFQRLLAYELLLEEYPEWQYKVVLFQLTTPSHGEEDNGHANNRTANKVSELVGRINSKFGGLDYQPIVYFSQWLSKDEYYALLRVADVGLITTSSDGMNTMGLEYVVCQKDNYGPLILSEFSATAECLPNAIHINPHDTRGVAVAINDALSMPFQERQFRQEESLKYVSTSTVQVWSERILDKLFEHSAMPEEVTEPSTGLQLGEFLLDQFRKAQKRTFLFDYDGTLTPIVVDPNAALPTERLLQSLTALASDTRNSVWIISGRDQAFLTQILGHIQGLGFYAEHGCFIRLPRDDKWENLAGKADLSWHPEVKKILQYYTDRTPGSRIEAKCVSLVWHFRRSDPDVAAFTMRECKARLEGTAAKNWDLEIMLGKACLEVRPKTMGKAGAVTRILGSDPIDDDPSEQFVLCVGDDRTDEDMFCALQTLEHVSSQLVHVGKDSDPTNATWCVSEPSDVVELIEALNSAA